MVTPYWIEKKIITILLEDERNDYPPEKSLPPLPMNYDNILTQSWYQCSLTFKFSAYPGWRYTELFQSISFRIETETRKQVTSSCFCCFVKEDGKHQIDVIIWLHINSDLWYQYSCWACWRCFSLHVSEWRQLKDFIFTTSLGLIKPIENHWRRMDIGICNAQAFIISS